MMEYKRVFNFVVRTISVISVLIIMNAIYQHDDDPGSHYLHPRRVMQ